MRDIAQRLQHRPSGRRVEARNRLVREENTRALREDARDRDTLLLTAREAVGTLRGDREQADYVERRERALSIDLGEATHEHSPHGRRMEPPDEHVVERARAPDEIELLKDEGRLAPSRSADLAAIGCRQARETAEERRLSRAARAEQRHELAVPHREIDVGENRPAAVRLRERRHAQCVIRHASRRRNSELR